MIAMIGQRGDAFYERKDRRSKDAKQNCALHFQGQ